MPCAFHAKRPYPFQKLGPGCQFEVHEPFPEHDLIEADGQTWCPFHAPMEDKEGNKTAKENWEDEKNEDFNQKIYTLIDEARNQSKNLDLTGVVFPGNIAFTNKEFPAVCFYKSSFSGYAVFEGAAFSGRAGFNGAAFSSWAGFYGAAFREADFEGAAFSGPAGFHGATFSGHAIFRDATFSYAGFEGAAFHGWADFSAATGKILKKKKNDDAEAEEEDFIKTDEFQWVDFQNVTFGAIVTFRNRKFRNTTKFQNCTFTVAPDFHNCELHQDTDFDGADFKDRRSDGARRAYRTLKLAMENHRARQEEAMFYALEMESRRNEDDIPWTERAASWLYWASSGYGVSFIRPLGGFVAANAVFFLLYLIWRNPPAGCWAYVSGGFGFTPYWNWGSPPEGCVAYASKIFGFTTEQIVRPFGVWASSPPGSEVSLGIKLAAAFQTLIGLTLLAQFLLALRQRFRMR